MLIYCIHMCALWIHATKYAHYANDPGIWLRLYQPHILRSFDGSPLMAIKWLQSEESFDGVLFKGFQFQSLTNRDKPWQTGD